MSIASIGLYIVFSREAQWGSRGREFDSRHSDHKSNDFTLEIVGFFVYRLTSFGFDPRIRAGEKCSSGQFLLYNVVQCGILNATTQNLYIKENIDETVFMFALFKCRKSDKGRN